jgi:hypothetical protein
MDTGFGKRLKAMSDSEKRAVEFVAYLSSAYVIHRDPNPSAMRNFFYMILSDVPPEMAKRMMAMDEFNVTREETIRVIDLLDDEDLRGMAGTEAFDASRQSLVKNLSTEINERRVRMRAKRHFL